MLPACAVLAGTVLGATQMLHDAGKVTGILDL